MNQNSSSDAATAIQKLVQFISVLPSAAVSASLFGFPLLQILLPLVTLPPDSVVLYQSISRIYICYST